MIEEMRQISFKDCFINSKKIIVEFPAAFYNPKFSSGALTPLAAVSGACMSLFQDSSKEKVFPVYPTVWNGGKKKENMAKLIQELIGECSEWEFDVKPTREADFQHIIDAVGMAYWYADREIFASSKNEENYFEGNKIKSKKSGLN